MLYTRTIFVKHSTVYTGCIKKWSRPKHPFLYGEINYHSFVLVIVITN
jgi:hypothetical protein